ncbi:MAG: cytochrome c oxidase subunit 3 [Proteobacteria bacterium]|nr:cytochrome c oxidase subunit 3 [Pseudomonadota bacterium]
MTELVSAVSPERDVPSAQAPGILTFIVADVIIFGVLFVAFMMERSAQLALFDRSAAALNASFGLFNTLILITSGLFVVLAVDAARHGRTAATRGWLLASLAVGAGFGVTKLIEYGDKLGHGITMLSNDFFMFYFVLTGVHFLHFLAGMIVLALLWFRAGREPVDGPLFGWIESGALYWHMVDLLWIVIFPMLYLLGTR